MSKKHLTATGLRVILSITLFLIVAVAITLFYFANAKLKDIAVEVSHTQVDSNASQNNVQSLQRIQQELTSQQATIDRTNNIVADSQSYQYQNQILSDLNDYAAQAGIKITNLDFGSTSTAATPAPTTPAVPGATVAPPIPAGVKSTSVSVTLQNPIKYEALLTFIKSIEQNLTKMQISKVSLSKDASGSGVTSGALTIEVYIR
jgi:TolA-binding protein